MTDNLARQTTTAIAWSYLGVAGYVVLQVSANIAYARLLGPDQFGLFASGLLAIGILKVISDLGLGAALTQAASLDAIDIRVAFTRMMVAGTAGFLVMLIGSRFLAALLNDLRLVPVFRCFALALLCFPFLTVFTALLARKLDQKHAQIANVLGYGLGYFAVGLVGASLGFGAWSPIMGFFAQLLITTVVLYAYTRPDLRLLLGRRGAQARLTQFGLRAMLTTISNWLIYAMDNLLVQRLFGTRQFGIYSVAYSVVRTPVDHLVQNVQNVLLPASARIKDDVGRLGRSYIAVLDAVWLLTLPTFATVAVLSKTFVEALYGPLWRGAELILAPLALAMPFQGINIVTSALLWGTDSVGRDLKVQLLSATLLFFTILACARVSFSAVAWGVLIVYVIRSLLMMGTLTRIIQSPGTRIARSLKGGLCLTSLIVPALWALDVELCAAGVHPMRNLLIEGLSAATLWIGLVLSCRKLLLSDELRSMVAAAWLQLVPAFRVWRKRYTP